MNTPLPSTTGRTGDIPVLRPSEVQFGSLPVTDTTHVSINPFNIWSVFELFFSLQRQQIRHQPKSDQPRTTNDARLFTQPYAPRRDLNQGDYNNNRYYNNYKNNNNNYNNHHNRPPPQQQSSPQQHLPPSPMSVHRSPNINNYPKKNNLSPHIPHSSPQNIQMTASWSPGPYVSFYFLFL